MKTLKSIIDWCKMHIIIFIAIVAICLFSYVSFTSTVSFPVEYIQKIPFGILGAAVILWCAFFWMKHAHPDEWDSLDEKTAGGISDLTAWQKVLISYLRIFLFCFIAAVLAFAL